MTLSVSARGLVAKKSLALFAEGSAKSVPVPLGESSHAEHRRSTILELAQKLAKTRIVPDRVKIVVLPHIAEVAVTELNRAAEGLYSVLGPFEQGIATGEVVMGQRISGTEVNEAFVDLQALGIAAFERQIVALDTKHVHVIGVLFQNAAKKLYLEIELALIVSPDKCLPRGSGFGTVK